jgi:hypothetical protein
MALIYQRIGFAVIIDDFFDPFTQLGEYDDLCGRADLHRCLVMPERETAIARNRNRGGDPDFVASLEFGINHVYDNIEPMVTSLADEGWTIIDNTRLTVDETVAKVEALAE